MKSIEKWYIIFLLGGIALFVIFRLYHVFQSTEIEIQPHVIDGEIPEIEEQTYQLDLVMVGDALYHDGVYKDGKQADGSYQFFSQLDAIKSVISSYDLAYYNQESILGGLDIGLSTYPRFNSPYEVGDAFVDAGFNLVSTANNHTLDRGREAVLNSFRYWKSKNVLMSGSCDNFDCLSQIPVGEMNGITYAFLSYTTTTNGISVPNGEEYLVNIYSEERVRQDIEKIKDEVDVILVAMHWGSEYQDYPNQEQKQIAAFLASLGVTIVIGNHPHVIEPIEQVGNTLIFYSLGNFISAQKGLDQLVGLMASVSIIKKTKGEEKQILLSNLRTRLTYTYYDSHYRNFKVYLLDNVDSSILVNKEKLENEKKILVGHFGVDSIWET